MEERLRIFEKPNIISRNSLDQSLCGGQCTEGYPEVIGIVEGIEEIFVERMNILQSWEAIENGLKLFAECF